MFTIITVSLSGIWTRHKRKMMELQLQMRQAGDANLQATVEALREEVRALRDTTMQYDLSFDTALQRMENRLGALEQRANESEQNTVANLRSGR